MKKKGLVAAALCAAAMSGAGAPVPVPTTAGATFDYHVVGAIDRDTGVAVDATPAKPRRQAVLLEGGDAFLKESIAWLVARSGGGNLLVLRANGGDWYNRAIWQQVGGVFSVETIVTRTRKAAFDPFVLDRIAKADAIFITGGNQADYIRRWEHTPLQRAINDAVRERHVPIGGTSAGMMVLGQFAFSALAGSVGSTDVQGRPDHPGIALARDLLSMPGLANTIADSHFDSRNRLGRLVTFMARTVIDGWTSVDDARAIGVGGRAALVIEDGVASVIGEGAVHLMRPLDALTSPCGETTLPFRSVQVQRLDARSGPFSLTDWMPVGDEPVGNYVVSLRRCEMTVAALGRKRPLY